MFAVLTFYSNFLIRDTRPVVGQATFHVFDNPRVENPPTEWSGEYRWKSKVPTLTVIDPPEDEITTISPPKDLYVKPSSLLRFSLCHWQAVDR